MNVYSYNMVNHQRAFVIGHQQQGSHTDLHTLEHLFVLYNKHDERETHCSDIYFPGFRFSSTPTRGLLRPTMWCACLEMLLS